MTPFNRSRCQLQMLLATSCLVACGQSEIATTSPFANSNAGTQSTLPSSAAAPSPVMRESATPETTGVGRPAGSSAEVPATMPTAGMRAGSGSLAMPVGGAGSLAAPDKATPGAPVADCLDITPSAAEEHKTPYPGGRWTVPAATYATVIQNDLQIEMSDGAVLVGDVTYPAELGTRKRAAGKFPVILTLNPYGSLAFGPQYGEIFVTHGYIFATVDVRGTSRSGGGPQDLFSPRDADDGAEVVAWAAKLDGADGKIGLQGCSQLGINQLETATRLGPNSPVKAMIPNCPSGDFYRDTAFDNGIASITAQALVPDADMGADTAYYREYWQMRDRVARAPTIAQADIPVLLWSGWNEPGSLGSFELYTVLQNVAAGRSPSAPITGGLTVTGKYQVVVGDWGHGGGIDLGIELQWYDTWIKGIDTGLPTDTKSPLHIAELGGTKRWFNARCYPFVERYTALYLSASDGLAKAAESAEASDTLKWVPQDQPSAALVYTSDAFATGAMLAGPIAAQLQVTSSNTNVQLYTEVLDRAPNGTLTRITFGSVLGSLRATDPDKSWKDPNGLPTRPFLSLNEDKPLTPNEKTQLVVPLGTKVWSIEPMHSIVVRIAAHPPSDDCIGVIVPPVGCYPSKPMLKTLSDGQYQLHVGGQAGSLISLPLLDHGAMPTIKASASPSGDGRTPLPIEW